MNLKHRKTGKNNVSNLCITKIISDSGQSVMDLYVFRFRVNKSQRKDEIKRIIYIP